MPPITGPVLRVENQRSHRAFVDAAEPETVLLDLIDARQIVKRGETASEFFESDPTVVTTSTIPDDKLEMFTWERERDVIREFQPDYHVPTDYPVYSAYERTKRLENLENLMRGSAWMRGQLADAGVEILPLVKGYTLLEREICYRAIENDMRLGTVAFYGTQYFTEGFGHISQLVDDLEAVDRESDLDVVLIGLLSPNYVEKLPDNVVAVTGQNQWRKRVSPTEDSDERMRDAYHELLGAVEDALSRR